MTIDDFLISTASRIPTVEEMIDLCDSLQIGFQVDRGVPSLRVRPENRAEGEILAKLFRREPFRSEVLESRLASADLATATTSVATAPAEMPADAKIVVADENGNTDKAMRGPAYMWTWIGAERWYYVATTPVPMRRRKAEMEAAT